ncbi:MAG: hypothetical protein WKF95_12455, partial [Rubrobacter sp.]
TAPEFTATWDFMEVVPEDGANPPPDTAAPETTITAGPSGTVDVNDATFGFSSSEANSTFKCKLDDGSFTSCSSPKNYGGLDDGPHVFQVRATDAADNTDPSPASRSWTVDTAPPPGDTAAPRIGSPRPAPGARLRDRTPRIGAVVRDGGGELGKADIKFYVDGKARAFNYSPDTGRLSHASKRLSYGGHTVKVVATDGAGNKAAETWRFKVVKKRR